MAGNDLEKGTKLNWSNYQIIIEYDGTDYNGWQYQKNGSSIQNEIEKALKKVLKKYELLALGELTQEYMQLVNQNFIAIK